MEAHRAEGPVGSDGLCKAVQVLRRLPISFVRVGVCAAVGLGFGMSVALVTAMPASADSVSYSPTGGEQVFTVPAGVNRVQLVAVGGQGGLLPAALVLA